MSADRNNPDCGPVSPGTWQSNSKENQHDRSRGDSEAQRRDVVDGDFTLKGVTQPVALTLVFNGVNPGMGRGEVAGFDAAVVLSRKDFGVGAELPLDGGGTMVGDKVTITLALEALKQA
jgi:polyisoprenoid-binding protein YceI